MKFLKIKIARSRINGGTRYTYPPEYDATKIQVMCYESGLKENYDAVVARGDSYEYLIGAVKDADATGFLKSKNVEEITEADALSYGNSWTKPAIVINDPNKVVEICQKVVEGGTLLQSEKDAIDPTKSTTGIITKGVFSSAITDMKATLQEAVSAKTIAEEA